MRQANTHTHTKHTHTHTKRMRKRGGCISSQSTGIEEERLKECQFWTFLELTFIQMNDKENIWSILCVVIQSSVPIIRLQIFTEGHRDPLHCMCRTKGTNPPSHIHTNFSVLYCFRNIFIHFSLFYRCMHTCSAHCRNQTETALEKKQQHYILWGEGSILFRCFSFNLITRKNVFFSLLFWNCFHVE